MDADRHVDAHRAKEFVYGTIAVLIVISGIESAGPRGANAAGAIILVGAAATWFAHAYADTLGVRLASGRTTTAADGLRALRDAWPIVVAALPATVATACAALGFWTLGTGLAIANILALVALAAAGWLAARGSGSSLTRSAASAVVSTSIGLGIVAMELLVHH